ncbi:MAG: serine hydrolase domain-containing protein [Gemmatimonadota bacterium]|nr:serine hydrolase domain-containing protein [Gemmatimonadota bacterium]
MTYAPSYRTTLAALALLGAGVALVSAAAPALGQSEAAAGLPAHTTTERVEELIGALNSGSRDVIAAFVDDRYTDEYSGFGSARSLTNYWLSVAREIGPMEIVRFEPLDLGERTLEVYWVRGTGTRFWFGVRLDVEEEPPHRIEGNSVTRGFRPRGGPRVDPSAVGTDPFDPGRLSAYLDAWLSTAAAGGQFSGSVAVLKDGQPVYEAGFGLADRERGIEASPETPFRLASVTKMFTGVAIAQLAEAGRLSYDDPLSRFVPEYPRHIADQVTVHHLLTHTSGIEIDDDPDFNRAVARATSLRDLLEAQLTYIERLNRGNYDDFEPLTEFDYTNEGIDLLGIIVERVSGKPWDRYLRDHVLAPADMATTGPHVLDPPAGLAVPYSVRAPGGGWLAERRAVEAGSMMGTGRIRPAGSGWSTAPDMARFVRALTDGTLLGAESYARMTAPQVELPSLPGEEMAYGYTLDVARRNGHRTLGHGGGAPGISTRVAWYPEDGWTVIVLSNLDRAGSHVFRHIEEMLGVR